MDNWPLASTIDGVMIKLSFVLKGPLLRTELMKFFIRLNQKKKRPHNVKAFSIYNGFFAYRNLCLHVWI
jgi:hypothetical protein